MHCCVSALNAIRHWAAVSEMQCGTDTAAGHEEVTIGKHVQPQHEVDERCARSAVHVQLKAPCKLSATRLLPMMHDIMDPNCAF